MIATAGGTSTETIVFTTPEIFNWFDLSFRYDAIRGISIPRDHTSYEFGDTSTTNQSRLQLPTGVSQGLATIIQDLESGVEVDCHRFAKAIAGQPYLRPPQFADVENLPVVDALPVGSSGVITAQDPRDVNGVPHSIGYGLGGNSLQVLSYRGELGIAADQDVVDLCRKSNEGGVILLHAYPYEG